MKPIIVLAADHAGFELKESVKKFLVSEGYSVDDMGAHTYDKEDDYPDFMIPAAQKVVATKHALGIIFGGSGQGEAIAANRVKGSRAALYYGGNRDILTLSKEHNDANILSLGSRFLSDREAKDSILLWLCTKGATEKRHLRRVTKIDAL